ncbi:hypothetical protein SBX64_15950 [Vibrio rhizosphaerae]|uniref:XRE family transcriptional regulator n=1 Tax=Vibrio rhizosphaerae TaxID=398736 RepID=A0ABU4IY31_9VIBR|nr:hypothetical protein [Vibrio rhizosphaerae]MDW6094032.1 hypothetical protein [Vibrio rhizosphaerae]
MEFTTTEIAAMRKELMVNAFSSLVRQMPMGKTQAYEVIAEHLNISYSTVLNMPQKGVSEKHARKLPEIAQRFEILMYPYQFVPTDVICRSWLEHAYQNDKGKQIHKHIFGHWERDMTRVKVREAA